MTVLTQKFTVAEAAALVGLSERDVRKEIEYKVINGDSLSAHVENNLSTLRLPFSALVYLYLVRRSSLLLRSRERSSIYKRIVQILARDEVPEQIEVEDPFYLRFSDGVTFLDDKIKHFLEWKADLVSDSDIMGGAATFPNSRLTVRHVGEMLERGVDAQEILEDYPYLDMADLEFARVFVRAYPNQAYAFAN